MRVPQRLENASQHNTFHINYYICIQSVIMSIFVMKIISISSLHLQILVMLACFAVSNAVQSDINCLRSIKESLEDPENFLASWNFSNNTEGFICRFSGVDCWHIDESKVLNIRLSDMGLGGTFPMGIKNCTSLTGLDLSSNSLRGPIPSNLSDVLPFISNLDLSSNDFSGPIPPSIANISFIHVLRLDNNQLTGQIPAELGQLNRIKEFIVANNRLSGQVPIFLNLTIPIENYEGNLGLCGGPLSRCKSEDDQDVFFSGFEIGFPISTILTMSIMFCYLPRLSISNMRPYLLMIGKINGRKQYLVIPENLQILSTDENSSEESKVTAMEKYICRLTLVELIMATNDFDNKKVIGYGNMGLMYKAAFPNGLLLAVKRLHKFESFEKEFLLEVEILGRLRHTNLVPILGFCFETEKKFLLYKYMCNGTLHQWLHSKPQVEGKKMGWTLRFRIAVGIARGLAWLHYNNVLRVAHQKISSKCILLDDKFEPKISNFGYSNILMNTSGIPSSSFNFVVPDSSPSPYKEDVYRFGILLLELITGKDPSMRELSVIDECLMEQGFDEEIHETLRIAETCIQAHQDGATSMLQVYQAMRAIGISRNEISAHICMDVKDNEGDV